jgi:hypothetical protein
MVRPTLSSQGKIFFCGLLLFATFEVGRSYGAANSPQQPMELRTLSSDAPIERELSGGQAHTYRIALNAGQYALVQLEQRGVDVLVTAKAPDGKEFASVNLLASVEGVEPLMIVAETAGDYILKVIAVNPKAAPGRYETKLRELRDATVQDRERAKAQSLCYEALTFSMETSPEAKRKAVQLYGEALPIWQHIPEPLWESTVLLRQGRLHISLSEFRQAQDYFSRALLIRKPPAIAEARQRAERGL